MPNPFSHSFGGLYGEDPLGIALKGRAQEARSQQHLSEMDGDINAHQIGGPLPDPAWDGLFQAMAEKGVRRMGVDSGTGALPSTRGLGQQSAIENEANGGSETSNLANVYRGHTLGIGEQPQGNPLKGLQGAFPNMGPDYQSQGQWMETHGPGNRPRVVGQRGTTGLNQSQRFKMPGTY